MLLIKGANVVMPDGTITALDVEVTHDRISSIGVDLPTNENYTLINGTGLYLMAGVIDPQVHFREPGLEHKEDLRTASHACAKGGVTSFLEMPNTRPTTTTQANLDDKLHRAKEKSVVNYGFFVGANGHNNQFLQTARPTCGVKVFMGAMHGELLIDRAEILETIFGEVPRLIAVHAEDQDRIAQRKQEFLASTSPITPHLHSLIQDETCALLATQKAVQLSQKYHRRLHILHLSTAMEVEFLRQHKTPLITCEVTPQHLFLDTTAYNTLGTLVQMNPPIRSRPNCDSLWAGLRDGTIDLIATDHAPHTLTEKAQPYPHSPSGMPGVETSLALMLTAAVQGKCTIPQVSNWMSQQPARAYGIKERGTITQGFYADLILVDLQTWQKVTRNSLLTKCGWSPFEGWHLTGWVHTTIVNGKIVYADGRVLADGGGMALEFLGA